MERDEVESVRTGELTVLPQIEHEKSAVKDAFSEPESTKVAFIAMLDEAAAAAGEIGRCFLLDSCSALGLSLLTVVQSHVMSATSIRGEFAVRRKTTVVLTYVSATRDVEGDEDGSAMMAPFKRSGTGGRRTRSPVGNQTHSA